MSKTLRLLAVSALALGASFVGYNQASAFSPGSAIILAQAGGGAGGGSGSGGGGTDGNVGPGAPQQTGPSASPGGSSSPGASTSPGVPAECANMQDAALRQQCIDRNRAATPGAMPSTGTNKR